MVAMRVTMMGMSGPGEPAVTVALRPRVGWAFAEGNDSHPIAIAGTWRDVATLEALFT
jgi:hypothetical protein